MEDLGASVNIMPKSIFAHLKLACLKEIDMVVADMMKKVTLGIVKNILKRIKWDAQTMDVFLDHERQIVGDSFDVQIDFGKTQGDPYSRRFDEYKEEIENEIKQLAKEYDLRRKKYAFNDVWEKCKEFHDKSYLWHDEGFEEQEQWESGIEKTNYEPPIAKIETFEVK
nr:RNA-directed DNA polymerase, eukaryota, reverse transcriptase zinc-binding domain protein [Tanacetum cinerariifolium]